MSGLGALGSSYLLPRPAIQFGGGAGQGFSFSVQTDTSGAQGDVDKAAKAAQAAQAAAAGSANQNVNMLAGLAKSMGANAGHKTISAFTMDASGTILSQAALDGEGDLTVTGSGSAQGATSRLQMYVPGSDAANSSWSSNAQAGLALASYDLGSYLSEVADGGARKSTVSATA